MRSFQITLAVAAALAAAAFPGTATAARPADDPGGGSWSRAGTCQRDEVCLYRGTYGRDVYRRIRNLPPDCTRVSINPRPTRSIWNRNDFPVRLRVEGGAYLDLGAGSRRGDLQPPRQFRWIARNTCFVPPT